NPLKTDFGVKPDASRTEKLFAILEPLVRAACGDNHILLQQAWDAANGGGAAQAAIAELTAVPFDEAKALELGEAYRKATPDAARKMQESWTSMFESKFKKIAGGARTASRSMP